MNALIIGYGSIGKKHYQILSKFKNIISIDIVTKQNIEGITTFRSLQEIKDLNHYSYFIISNETYKHFETLQHIDKKIKNKKILIEKPIFKDYIKYKSKNQIFVAYNLRFHPIIQFLKKKKIIFFSCNVGQDLRQWRQRDYKENYSSNKKYGGGVLRDLSHEIDYIQYLNGKIKTINSTVAKQSLLELNCEDIVVANGKTANTVFAFSLDYISKTPFRNIIAHTNTETFVCDLIKNTINEKKLKSIDNNYTYKKMHKSILKDNLNIICNYKEGMNTMKIIQRIEHNG